MDRHSPDTPELEKTLISAVPPAEVTAAPASRPHVEFVTGSGPGLEAETQALLRVRLRAAAFILCAAVIAFFVRDLFLADAPAFWFRAITLLGLLALTGRLVAPKELSLGALRGLEAAMFGLIALYLGVYEYELVLTKAREGNPAFELAAVKSCVLYFF